MAHIAMALLLLLPFITNGTNGADDWILAERRYNIRYPCGGLVCFHLWEISTKTTSDYIGVITNGEMQTAQSDNEISKCTLPVESLKREDAGHDICKRNSKLSFPVHKLNVTPVKAMSLQCVLLTDVRDTRCFTQQFEQISLRWVDEDDVPVQVNSQYDLKQQSDCDVTLTVNLQSPGKRRFKCQASVGDQTWTSEEVLITFPDVKQKGRGLVINSYPDPPPQGANQDAIGVAVGVVACVVLTAGAVLFVVNKRKANNLMNQSNESCYSSSANDVMDEDDVVYAEVTVPLGLDRPWGPVCESTEYACVRYA
ncbi:uncharacterized protein LOC115415305 isoform X2 [Sphaeramia orbicularis]|uniref:uncharacterized protein LOC115415305 isoform X2 n=1 Tax=Sphaeramia orbicularis TaxID=375764 RepID=UPI0011806C72|nr:uncharacterized protein LOC115415305 isoform X2 [Sphaeramia orbicularis]